MRIFAAILRAGLLVFPFMLISCKSKPSVTIEEPYQYLKDKLIETDHNAWWNPYRITDDEFITGFLDARIAKEKKWQDGLPSESKELDRFYKSIRSGLALAHTADEETRARMTDRIRARFENPQIKLARRTRGKPGFAIVDLGFVPGEWKSGRGGWDYKSHGTDSYRLAPEDITRGFRLAHEAYPEAIYYLIAAKVHFGASIHREQYLYDKATNLLFHVHNVQYRYSRDSYELEQVLSGEATPSKIEMDGTGEQTPSVPVILNAKPFEDPKGYHMEYFQE